MFGMLDYRAHKLYVLLFGVPLFLITWALIIGRPALAYLISYSYFESTIAEVLGAVALTVLLELVLIPVGLGLSKLVHFLFTLFVDVIPANGRTEEEAKHVVWNGEKALLVLEMNKRPSEWSEKSVENFVSLDWIQAIFFKQKVLDRLTYIKKRYDELDRQYASGDQTYPYNEWAVRDLLKEGGIEPPTEFEKFICNKMMRAMVYPYLALLLLILFDPLHS
jgi:hypothetical protein